MADLYAKAILAAYATIALTIVLWQALRWPSGPLLWVFSLLVRVHIRCGFRWRADGGSLPESGPAIIIANHRSSIDPMFIWAGNKRTFGFMIAREYYEMRGLHFVCRTVECIPVDRDGKDHAPIRAALRRLRNGEVVSVFPEGGINRTETLRQGIPGVAWLALRSEAPVYPVFVHDSPGGKNMMHPFYNFCRVRVTIGEPIDLSAYSGRRPKREVLLEVTDLLMSRLAELGDVDYQSHSDEQPAVSMKRGA